MHQFALSHCGSSLFGGRVLGAFRQVQLADTHAHRTGGNQQQFLSRVVEVGQDPHQIGHAANVQFSGFMCQRGSPQLENDTLF